MSETREVRTLLDLAEQAAAEHDHVSAERLLREAAAAQESQLGPMHPDLANTLNNLGVVSEIAGKPDEAERFFRRAYEIATVSLAADHPFVATSRTNLEEFLGAQGKSLEMPALPTASPVQPGPAPAAKTVAPVEPKPPARVEPKPAVRVDAKRRGRVSSTPAPPNPAPVRRRPSRPLLGAAAAAGVLIGMLFTTRPWVTPTDQAPPPTASPAQSVGEPAAAPAPSPPPPPSGPPGVEPPPRTEPVVAVPRETPKTPEKKAPAAPSSISVVDAKVCSRLSPSGAWPCETPGSPAAPGPFYFYTRVKSPVATTMQHRWYRGDSLRQSVSLSIGANPSAGYRTFSRQTVTSDTAGEWRVELRTSEGALVHEERFTVK